MGAALAERARAKGITAVAWQRKHGQRFHGRIRALLEAMQSHGVPLE